MSSLLRRRASLPSPDPVELVRAPRRVLLPCACALLTACGFAHVNRDSADRPERSTGSAARVILPGEAPPDMSEPVVTSEPVLIGGGSAESDRSERVRDVPLGPLAVLFGYPFWILGER